MLLIIGRSEKQTPLCGAEMETRMGEYEQQRMAALLSLRGFPRSLGMWAAAISLAISLDPITALALGLPIWFAAWLIKSLAGPRLVDTYLWQAINTCVLALGAWILKWPVYVALVLVALFRGAPLTATLWCMGGFLLLDVFTVITKRS